MATKKATRKKASAKLAKEKELRKLSKKARTEVAKLLKRDRAGTVTAVQMAAGLKELDQNLKLITSFIHTFKYASAWRDWCGGTGSMKFNSASCQIAYWNGGRLRIANYLTRRTFSANPIALDVIGFFFTPATIEDALVEFRCYSPKSVATAILELIDAQLLLEYGSAEWKRDRLVESSWGPWLPEGGFHFMTKDTPYIPWDWPIREKIKA